MVRGIYMIEHIAILKFKSSTSKDQKDLIILKLKNLRGQISNIIDFQVGLNFSDRSQGFEIGVTARFEDRKYLEDFILHPAHQEVVSYAKKVGLIETITVDFLI